MGSAVESTGEGNLMASVYSILAEVAREDLGKHTGPHFAENSDSL